MVESFFERPILNSPYTCPGRHWELDGDGQPTNRLVEAQRRSELITPVPRPQRRRRAAGQGELGLGAGDGYLRCLGGTYPAQLMYQDIADRACERIAAAITASMVGAHPVKTVLDPYNPTGSTAHVRFDTAKTTLWQTDPRRCHVNYVVCDSDWEAEFCRAAEANPHVSAYVKNQGLGFEVPYLLGTTPKRYRPDFIVRLDDGRGGDDLLNLVVEIKGYRGEDAKDWMGVSCTRSNQRDLV